VLEILLELLRQVIVELLDCCRLFLLKDKLVFLLLTVGLQTLPRKETSKEIYEDLSK
jgi:hypothetical protein